jgi:hypothetical protein
VLLVLASVKGAPGVSTAARALAAAWPAARSPVLLELDPSGGDLIVDFGLDAEPGLMSLAAAARRGPRLGLAREHAQRLPGGLLVVPAPSGAEQAAAAVDVLLSSAAWDTMPGTPPPGGDTSSDGQAAEDQAAAGQPGAGRDVLIVDAGRLPTRAGPGVEVSRLLRAADAVLVVARNDARGLVHAAARVEHLTSMVVSPRRLRLLLVNSGPYPAEDVGRGLGVPVAGVLPIDARAARTLAGRPARRPAVLRRSALIRAAREVAGRLAPAQPPGTATVATPLPAGALVAGAAPASAAALAEEPSREVRAARHGTHIRGGRAQ